MAKSKEEKDWKSHPVVTAAIGFGAGVAFAMTWLAPAHMGNLRYEVEDARKIELSAQQDKNKISQLSSQLEQTRDSLNLALLNDLLSFGSPYPNGLAFAKIGDPASELSKKVPAERLNKKRDTFWIVDTNNPHFNRAFYWLANDGKTPRIRDISYSVAYDSPLYKILQKRLVESLGLPTMTKPDEDNSKEVFFWSLPMGLRVEANDNSLRITADDLTTSSISKQPKR